MAARSVSTPAVGLAIATAVAYVLVGLFRHWHFSSSAFDLGLFDQVVWHMSRFEAPASTVLGFANVFGDHFHPILYLFVPAYWLASGPETLIVVQSLVLGASVISVHAFARSRLSGRPAFALTSAYALFWGMQRTAWFDVHELAFAPLCIAGAVLALDRRAWGWVWVACGFLALVKEDQIPIVIALGLFAAVTIDRRRGVWLAVAATLWFLVVVNVLIPYFNPSGVYTYEGSFREALTRPWLVPVIAVTPVEKVRLIAFWLLPFALLSLRSPLAWLLVPIALARLLSSAPNHWGTGGHYSAPLAPLLAMSAADGLSRLLRGLDAVHGRRLTMAACTIAVVLSALLPGHQPVMRVVRAKHYQPVPFAGDARTALAAIPDTASVVAQVAIVPHLSRRRSIYVLDADAPDADFVIASADVAPWPNDDQAAIDALLARRLQSGYRAVVTAGRWIVLQRHASAAGR